MRFLLLLLSLTPYLSYSQQHYKHCTLLPITDDLGGALSFQLFTETEEFLKNGKWCLYKSNSGLLNVFTKYKDNLRAHLKDPKVLQVVAEKNKVGSIIKIDLVNEINSIEVSLEVFGPNGEDILFSEKELMGDKNLNEISLRVRSWLNEYAQSIPYDGLVSGVLGDQITLDLGKLGGAKIGDGITLSRLKNIKKHPLLGKVVEFEKEKLAEGKIFNMSGGQVLAVVNRYLTDEKIQANDWVVIEKSAFEEKSRQMDYPEVKASEFGKLGVGKLFFLVGNHSATSVINSGGVDGTNKVNGIIPGLSLELEAWILRNYFASVALGRSFGTLKKAEGDLESDSVGTSHGFMKLWGGYKFLPLGYFFGPQIDFYVGYSSYTFDMDQKTSDGFSENSINGLMLGIKGDIPLMQSFRGYLRGEIMGLGSFSEKSSLYGSNAESVSSLQFELGGRYLYNPLITLEGGIQITNNKAKFTGTNKEISYSDTAFKFGAGYIF